MDLAHLLSLTVDESRSHYTWGNHLKFDNFLLLFDRVPFHFFARYAVLSLVVALLVGAASCSV